MLDSIYYMTLTLLLNRFLRKPAKIFPYTTSLHSVTKISKQLVVYLRNRSSLAVIIH